MNKICSLIITLSFVVMPAFAIENITLNQVLSIEDCVSIALNNSPEIKMYENKKAVAKAQVNQAKSAYTPSFGVGTGFYDTVTNENNNYYNVNVNIQQLIYNFGKTGAKIQMQKMNLEAADFNLENSILATTHAVRTAYYELLAAKAARDVEMQNVSINKREYERTKAFFEEGLKSKIDLVNAEVNYSDSKIKLVNADNVYQAALINLNNKMFVVDAPKYEIKNTEAFNIKTKTIPADINFVTKKEDVDKLPTSAPNAKYEIQVEKQELLMDYEFKPFAMSMDDAIKTAYENRPDIKALNATLNAMKESLKYYKREYLPDLTAKGGYTFRTSGASNNSFNLSASLDIASVNPVSVKSKIDEAKEQLKLAENNLDLLKKNTYFEVQNAYVNMQQIEKKIPLLATKVRQALENYELADGRYEVSLGNFLELQDAKNNYNYAQLEFVSAVFQYNNAMVKVQKAMGVK